MASPYYVVQGTQLIQCPSLEDATKAASEYRQGAVEDLNRIMRRGAPSALVSAMTDTATAAVFVRIAANHRVMLSEFRQILTKDHQLLAALTAREQQIVRMHFGIEQATLHAIEEISVQLGLPAEQVRAIEVLALHKLGSDAAGRRIRQFQSDAQEERQRFLDNIKNLVASDEEIRDLLASDPEEDLRALKGMAIFEEILDVVRGRASSGLIIASPVPPVLFHAIILECAYVTHLNHRYRPPANAISNVDLRKKFLSDLRETKFRVSVLSLMQTDYPDWLCS